MRLWAFDVGAGEEERAFVGAGRSREVRTEDVGVLEGDCGTWGGCMRVELAGDWGRGEDVVAMTNCLCRESEGLATAGLLASLNSRSLFGSKQISHFSWTGLGIRTVSSICSQREDADL